GVGDQVQEDLAEFVGYAGDRRHRVGVDVHRVVDSAVLGVALPAGSGQLDRIPHQGGDVEVLGGAHRWWLGELLDAADRPGAGERGPADRFQPLLQRRVGGEPQEDLGPSEDGGEQIVEVVGEPGGQVAQGAASLVLYELLLRG